MGAYADLNKMGDLNADSIETKKSSRTRVWVAVLTVLLVCGFGGIGGFMYDLQEQTNTLNAQVNVNLTEAVELIREANANYTALLRAINQTELLANANKGSIATNTNTLKQVQQTGVQTQTELKGLSENVTAAETVIDDSLVKQGGAVSSLQQQAATVASQVATNQAVLAAAVVNVSALQTNVAAAQTMATANQKNIATLTGKQNTLVTNVGTNTGNIATLTTNLGDTNDLAEKNEKALSDLLSFQLRGIQDSIKDLRNNVTTMNATLSAIIESNEQGLLNLEATKLASAGLSAKITAGTVKDFVSTVTCATGSPITVPVGTSCECTNASEAAHTSFTANSVTCTCETTAPKLSASCLSVVTAFGTTKAAATTPKATTASTTKPNANAVVDK
eukprot:m.210316 g.210316  ORF g.210316 m.210316 type:complete len:392 (-) comp33070_c0_seq5:234-1409(-)